ncbi:hypothetical protein PVAP13_9KG332800 [Panicum virgatum]|uniref:Embryo surrounding factor 1 brassicaceae domain-containing protein n=1 Tax=Panicum virgatum TaxID=38727 RepID=A0A8T0NJ99_PANVG|nr:hypothetical protein PVAP13_9KG332800 [Panicum virgatum]
MATRSLRYVVTILLTFSVLLGCFCLPAECRPHHQRLEARSAIPAAINLTTLDESKIKIIWCLSVQCDYFGHGMQDCFCCGDPYQTKNCYQAKKECMSKCPACNPQCPTQDASSIDEEKMEQIN